MALQQTLKNLCSKSGWCYAVFWKLKRRSRMVLTWEDGYYEFQSSDNGGKMSCLETGGNPLVQGGDLHDDRSYYRGQIGLAVAKMSYCVYLMGEGIIGRVAFTGKHQWIFGDGDTGAMGTACGNAIDSRCMLEKYPYGWEVQFAAGIKTIAIIAVPQGVVQLGSTQAIMENIEWVDHVKRAFGALQSAPGPVMPLEGSGGNMLTGMPTGNLSTRLHNVNPSQPSSRGMVDVANVGLQLMTYGVNGSLCASAQQNARRPAATVIEPPEALQTLAHKPEILQVLDMEMGTSVLQPSVFNSSSQSSEPLPIASDLRLLTNQQQALIPGEDFRGKPSRIGFVQCPLVDTFNGAPELPPDTHASTSLYGQSNKNATLTHSRVLDSSGHLPPLPVNDQNLKQAKGTAQFGSYCSANMVAPDLSGVVSNTGGDAAGREDSLVSSFGGKSHGNQELLADFTAGGMSHRNFANEVIQKPCSAGRSVASFSEGGEGKDLIPGGWDSFETYLASVGQGQSSNWDCSFGIGDELSQALGPCFSQNRAKRDKPLDMDRSKIAVDQCTATRTCTLSESAAELMATWGSNSVKSEPLLLESKEEPLLDAVVASASSSHLSVSTAADARFSCRTFSAKDGELPASKVTKTDPFKHASSHSSQDCMSQSFLHTGPVDCEASVSNQAISKVLCDPLGFNMSATYSPLKTILSSWTEDMQSARSDSTQSSQLKKPEDQTKATRKRARPGESTRPRPKDRQQIQDRVRELREIVPNGSKCSIDALLEKTIKHMLFLQNVTLHADNLKKNGELKEDVESGASWALELGGEESDRPPILVKNLAQPRQLLVEMFCEEKGHFLEIADIIRSLGLAILKGVMESRSDKIWARFVVEANRDVMRVDIMMSLMHLLHVNNNTSSSMTMGSQTAPLRSQPG